jgi:hypothetical protein
MKIRDIEDNLTPLVTFIAMVVKPLDISGRFSGKIILKNLRQLNVQDYRSVLTAMMDKQRID